MKTWLIDTGPLVAYLDAKDAAHKDVVRVLDEFSGQLSTTSAVITETMHFLADVHHGPRLLADLVAASAMHVVDFAQPPVLRRAADLMNKYSNVPMDYADATLVLLAEHLNTLDLLTLDRRGFSVYRTSRKRPFRLILG